MKKIISLVVVFGLFLSLFGSAVAANIIVPEKNDPNVVVGAAQKNKNLYTAGSNVVVNGMTEGDLAAAGGVINLVGDVEQDGLFAGGNLNLAGKIGGDVRLLGGNVIISSQIAGDMVGAGGTFNFTEKSSIGGDLILAGGNVYIDAPIKGNVKIAGGDITINSLVEGNVDVIASNQLVFGPKAQVSGKITLKSPVTAVLKDGAKVNHVEFTKIENKSYKGSMRAVVTAGFAIKAIAMFLAAWTILYLRRKKTLEALVEIQASPLSAFGWGLVGLIVMPVLIVFLFVTLVGYYIAIVALFAYFLMLLLASVLGALLVGKTILKYLKNYENIANWQLALVGVVAYRILSLVPVLGWLVILVVFLMSLGQIVKHMQNSFKQE